MSKKRQRMSIGPYVALPKRILGEPAWRAMSPEGRLLWIELRGWLRNDCLNNGKVGRACRNAAKSLGLSKNTITRRFAELEHYGFLRKTSEGFLGADGRGIFAKYRFTDLAHGTHPPTRDFEKWTGELFVYTPRGGRNYVRRPDRKKQKPVPREGTVRPTGRDIRRAPRRGSVCPTGRDIGSAPECPTGRDITSVPLPAVAKSRALPFAAKEQGSLTARAPAQAGGAGSSPAPVASLTEHVLGVVNAVLDEHEHRLRSRLTVRPALPSPTECADPVAGKLTDPNAEVPGKPSILPGDRIREEIRARNLEALKRFEATTRH